MKTVLKVLTALAAVAGAVYVIATYGDKIVSWCKNLLAACPCKGGDDVIEEPVAEEAEFAEEAAEEAPVEEPAAEEEVPAEEAPAEEAPAADDNAPVADEEDFEG